MLFDEVNIIQSSFDTKRTYMLIMYIQSLNSKLFLSSSMALRFFGLLLLSPLLADPRALLSAEG